MQPLLKISHLTKSYDGLTNALNDVTLTVNPNEFLVIIGPSGAGKSTFIRSINQLVKPTSGSVELLDQELTDLKTADLRKARTNMGMVFQAYNLIERSTVLQNVLNGRLGQLSSWKTMLNRYDDEVIQEAISLLTELGLKEHVFKLARELSGGQKQRVGIARALMQNPKLILADEPIASLDPKASSVVMDGLTHATIEKGISCIVNLHQVEIAKEYATRIVGIRSGEVVFDGTSAELTDDITAYIYEGKEEEATQFGTEG